MSAGIDMETPVAYGFMTGLVLAAPMGPVFAASLRHGLASGFGAALSVQLGSLVGDLAYAGVGLGGAALLSRAAGVETLVNLAGAALMLWFAWDAATKLWRPRPIGPASPGGVGGFAAGAAISFANVDTLAYWVASGKALEAATGRPFDAWDYATFLSSFTAASVLWCFGTAGLIAVGMRYVTPLATRVLNGLCVVMFLGMAFALVKDLP